MAQVIAEGYRRLVEPGNEDSQAPSVIDLGNLLNGGESGGVEFKATLRTNLHTGARDPKMELMALKTIAGFLNSSGGTLAVGVLDDGNPMGLDADGFENEDKMALHLVNIVKSRLGSAALTQIHTHFEDHDEFRVMLVRCPASATPIFVKDGEVERFYVRTGPSTTELSPSQTHEYLKQRFKA
jgi:predicted HTH transcriptional regulator